MILSLERCEGVWWLSSAALRSPCFSALSLFLPPALASAVLHLGRIHLFTVISLVHVDGARLVPFRRAALAGRSVVLFVPL